MTPFYTDDAVTLFHGDCLKVLASLPDASVDAVVTDPPYGLEFMGREWDSFKVDKRQPGDENYPDARPTPYGRSTVRYGIGGSYGGDAVGAMQAFQAWCELWAAECLRVLKPGGHMLAFGGSRTWHRLTCAIEDAGFEVRDSIAWIYGSGFPKSLDVSKAIDKAAGAEREVVGHQPLSRATGHMRHGGENSRPWQAAALAEGHGGDITAPATPDAQRWQGWGTALKPAFEPVVVARKPLSGTVAANVLAHGTGALNVDGCRVGTDGGGTRCNNRDWLGFCMGHEDAGRSQSGVTRHALESSTPTGRWPSNVVLDESQAAELDRQSGTFSNHARSDGRIGQGGGHGLFNPNAGNELRESTAPKDHGGASRFFPTFRYEPKAPTTERPDSDGTRHPTVKPLDLMRWLVRLVTPPGGTVLEPFAGSGTTAEACVVEGFKCVAIEREADYLPLIVQRLTKPIQVALEFD